MPAEITADASGTTFLVSISGNYGVYRINIATGAETLLFNAGLRPDGLAYDSAGDLFVVLNESEIAQVDPTTGAIVKTLALPTPPGAATPQANGLTYDAFTGFLYVASDDGGVYQINTALTSQTYTQILTPPNTITTELDGIQSTGNTLYIINRGQDGIQYLLGAGGSVATGSITETSPTFGSLGSSTPEPGSFLLIAAGGLLAIGIAGRRMPGLSAR